MKITIAGLNITIERNKHKKQDTLSEEKLLEINNCVLNQIQNIPESEFKNRIAEITIDAPKNQSELRDAKALLDKTGIVIIRNFLDAQQIAAAASSISDIQSVLAKYQGPHISETEKIFIQSRTQILRSYREMADYPKTVACIRQGADQGMIDVFNFDRFDSENLSCIRAPFSSPFLIKILQSDANENLKARNMNLYINQGITKTRGFHVDTYTKMIKGFAYLTDVKSLSDGPYCYVAESNRESSWRSMNRKIGELCKNGTEFPFIDFSKVIPVLAEKGSFILSDQSGCHRGLPQSPSAKRAVAVMAYY